MRHATLILIGTLTFGCGDSADDGGAGTTGGTSSPAPTSGSGGGTPMASAGTGGATATAGTGIPFGNDCDDLSMADLVTYQKAGPLLFTFDYPAALDEVLEVDDGEVRVRNVLNGIIFEVDQATTPRFADDGRPTDYSDAFTVDFGGDAIQIWVNDQFNNAAVAEYQWIFARPGNEYYSVIASMTNTSAVCDDRDTRPAFEAMLKSIAPNPDTTL